jgi:hypothetical protein
MLFAWRLALGVGGGSRRRQFLGKYKYPDVPQTLHRAYVKNQLASIEKPQINYSTPAAHFRFLHLAFSPSLLYSKDGENKR